MVNLIVPFLVGALSVAALPSVPSTNSTIDIPTVDGFEVVIVYVQPEGGCSATQCSPDGPFATSSFVSSTSKSTSTTSTNDKAYTSSTPGSKFTTSTDNGDNRNEDSSPTLSAEEPFFSEPGKIALLLPNVHWTTNTAPATNVIPLEIGDGSPFYYGSPGECTCTILIP
jgi:hypothetical protein